MQDVHDLAMLIESKVPLIVLETHDELRALEMLTRLEQHFRIELPDWEVQGVSDFRTLADRIQARL